MTRVDAERVRLAHALDRTAATVESVRLNASMDGAGLLNAAQALMLNALEIVVVSARIEAYERAGAGGTP